MRRIISLKREIKTSQEDLETVRKTFGIFEPTNRKGGNRLFRRVEMTRLIFDAGDPELTAVVCQRCLAAIYRLTDKGKVAKEPRGSVRAWRLL